MRAQIAILMGALMVAGMAAMSLGQDKPNGTRVTGVELVKLYTPPVVSAGYSHRWRHLYSNGYINDGVIHFIVVEGSGHGGAMQGTWRINNDALCTAFPPNLSSEQCVQIYKLQDGTYQSRSMVGDKLQASFQFRRMEE